MKNIYYNTVNVQKKMFPFILPADNEYSTDKTIL